MFCYLYSADRAKVTSLLHLCSVICTQPVETNLRPCYMYVLLFVLSQKRQVHDPVTCMFCYLYLAIKDDLTTLLHVWYYLYSSGRDKFTTLLHVWYYLYTSGRDKFTTLLHVCSVICAQSVETVTTLLQVCCVNCTQPVETNSRPYYRYVLLFVSR